MKRKQLQTEDTADANLSKFRPTKQRIKRELNEPASSDSDSDSWSDSNHIFASSPSLRSMKQGVIVWIREKYSLGEQGWTAKADIFQDYLNDWARQGLEPQLTAPAFGRLVHKAFPGIKSCRMGPRVRARHCYKGLVRRATRAEPSFSPHHSPAPTSSSASSTPTSSPIQHHAVITDSDATDYRAQSAELIDLESELKVAGLPTTDGGFCSHEAASVTEEQQCLVPVSLLKQETGACPTSYASSEEWETYNPDVFYSNTQPQLYASGYPCQPVSSQQAQIYHISSDCDTGPTSSSFSSPSSPPPAGEWVYPGMSTFYTMAGAPPLDSISFCPSSFSRPPVAPVPPAYYPTSTTPSYVAQYPAYTSWPMYSIPAIKEEPNPYTQGFNAASMRGPDLALASSEAQQASRTTPHIRFY